MPEPDPPELAGIIDQVAFTVEDHLDVDPAADVEHVVEGLREIIGRINLEPSPEETIPGYLQRLTAEMIAAAQASMDLKLSRWKPQARSLVSAPITLIGWYAGTRTVS